MKYSNTSLEMRLVRGLSRGKKSTWQRLCPVWWRPSLCLRRGGRGGRGQCGEGSTVQPLCPVWATPDHGAAANAAGLWRGRREPGCRSWTKILTPPRPVQISVPAPQTADPGDGRQRADRSLALCLSDGKGIKMMSLWQQVQICKDVSQNAVFF